MVGARECADVEYMKTICAIMFVLTVSGSTWAEEPNPLPPDASEREAPRLLLDNIVGIRVNALGPQGGEAAVTGGPVTASLMDQSGHPYRSLSLRAEVDGRVWKSLTVGGAVGFTTLWNRFGGPPMNEHTYHLIQLEPRIGALISLGANLYLWPRVGLSINVNIAEDLPPFVGPMTDVSLVVPLHRYVFLALGPRVDYLHQGPSQYSPTGADLFNVSFGSRLGVSF